MPGIVDSHLLPTTAREQLFLDSPEATPGRVELALHDGAILVGPTGPNWGDAAIEAYLADAARGSLPVDFRVPNRTIEIPLMLLTVPGGMTYDEARTALQHKAALIQREGGVLKRVLRDGRVVYADLIDATLHFGGGTLQALQDLDADATLVLQALPDWYGPEDDVGAVAASTDAELVFTLRGVRGDYPARTRIVVTDASGHNQRGLLWGLRSRHYDSAATARLAYDAEALTPLDEAAVATVASRSVVRHNSLAASWTLVLSTDLAGSGPLTHTGTYRVWARCYTTSSTPPRLRLVWDVGDFTNPVENPAVTLPGTGNFYPVDLGAVRLDAAPVGAHQWRGQIRALGAAGGENVSIDRLWLFPVDEGYGVLSTPVTPTTGVFAARDAFTTGSGSLGGKTLTVGGTWATSGATTDFVYGSSPLADVTRYVQRTTGADTSPRFAVAGSTSLAAVEAGVDIFNNLGVGSDDQGVLLRYVDANNYLAVVSNQANALRAKLVIAGAETEIASVGFNPWGIHYGAVFFTIRARVDPDGSFFVWAYQQGAAVPSQPILQGSHTALATGGTLAAGKFGIIDKAPSSGATRAYTNFFAYTPDTDAVLFANQGVELRHDGMFREDAAGAVYGPVSHVIGDLPRLPPAGMEDRLCEVIVKASRGEPGVAPDPAVDAISAHVYARPSWLFVPDVVPA